MKKKKIPDFLFVRTHSRSTLSERACGLLCLQLSFSGTFLMQYVAGYTRCRVRNARRRPIVSQLILRHVRMLDRTNGFCIIINFSKRQGRWCFDVGVSFVPRFFFLIRILFSRCKLWYNWWLKKIWKSSSDSA